MLSDDFVRKALAQMERSELIHKKHLVSRTFTDFEQSIRIMLPTLEQAVLEPDLIQHNRLNQAYIDFDRNRLAKNVQEMEIYDGMQSENSSAKQSILFMMNSPTAYKSMIEEAYGPYRKILSPPAKEACIVAYKNISKQLGHLKRGTGSSVLAQYYTARQDLLRSDLDLIAELQCKALGLEAPKKSKSVSQDKGLSLSR